MGDVDEGFLGVLLDLLELELHILAQLEVERSERLVKENDVRVTDEGARDRDTLLLTARKLLHGTLLVALEVYDGEHLCDLLFYLILRQLLELEAEGNVVIYIQMREQRIFLKDSVDVSLVRRQAVDPVAVKNHVAAFGLDKTADNAQRSGFSAAARAENRHEFLFMNIKVDVVENYLSVESDENIL